MSRPVARPINHFNYPDYGKVYCRQRHEIRMMNDVVDSGSCFKCLLYAGSIQGMGVECYYTDLQSEKNTAMFLPVLDPTQQLMYISDLMDKGLLPIDPEAGLEELLKQWRMIE